MVFSLILPLTKYHHHYSYLRLQNKKQFCLYFDKHDANQDYDYQILLLLSSEWDTIFHGKHSNPLFVTFSQFLKLLLLQKKKKICSSCFWNYKFILRFCHLFLNRFVTKMDLSQEGEKKDLAREISKYMCATEDKKQSYETIKLSSSF